MSGVKEQWGYERHGHVVLEAFPQFLDQRHGYTPSVQTYMYRQAPSDRQLHKHHSWTTKVSNTVIYLCPQDREKDI